MRRSRVAKVIIKSAPVERAANVIVLIRAKSGGAIVVMSIISGKTSGNKIIIYGEIKQVIRPAMVDDINLEERDTFFSP